MRPIPCHLPSRLAGRKWIRGGQEQVWGCAHSPHLMMGLPESSDFPLVAVAQPLLAATILFGCHSWAMQGSADHT
ncbi:hypothetical protein L207DRAFT_70933 [Hyaloscypha variabilis F]|uniref:Uncharacterized protein n=1 Tax=Hyaloscypha variabilis (strain UAMH 11265 / GT02V1 / F) TaxID=1149755 RepID=A0A2J6RJ84_HYAVF|nr:hypothetical protein L207DRAFT_70933 [Hyaloscypha variabilis F]